VFHFTAQLAAVVSCYYLLSQHILGIHCPTSCHRHFVATIWLYWILVAEEVRCASRFTLQLLSNISFILGEDWKEIYW
jgi:hypothetical protein